MHQNLIKGVLLVVIVILVFLIALLTGIDAGRVIKGEVPNHHSLRVSGNVLAFAQVIMSRVLLAFGAVYPVLRRQRDVVRDVTQHVVPVLPTGRPVLAALPFCGWPTLHSKRFRPDRRNSLTRR
jgi:hypothetical protein